jgi:hypothetical protein
MAFHQCTFNVLVIVFIIGLVPVDLAHKQQRTVLLLLCVTGYLLVASIQIKELNYYSLVTENILSTIVCRGLQCLQPDV